MAYEIPPPKYCEMSAGLDNRAAQYAAQIKDVIFWHASQLEGWCSKEKKEILVDLILRERPQKVVEIGVWGGASLIPMAFALRENLKGKIYGIDPWDPDESIRGMQDPDNIAYWTQVDHRLIFETLQWRIKRGNLYEQIELIRSPSKDALPISDIDILHIDGNHSEEASLLDVEKWVPLVRKGGWIIFDGLNWFEGGRFTTERAARWLDEHCLKLAEFTDNSCWGIWIKP